VRKIIILTNVLLTVHGQPQKDKILQKHEFSGNQPSTEPIASSSSGARGSANRGRASGGRGGRGRGGGRGGAGGDTARDRAWKDKNKASRANHNRKRGHDKKMARAGAGVPEP
jgi:activating signal cointegrator complex subunit 2